MILGMRVTKKGTFFKQKICMLILVSQRFPVYGGWRYKSPKKSFIFFYIYKKGAQCYSCKKSVMITILGGADSII